jgi:hypothetical protein
MTQTNVGMTGSVLMLDGVSRRAAPIVCALMWLGFALFAYTIVAIFHDPLPYPAQQIACGAALALVLAGDVWHWVYWFRSQGAHSSLARQVTQTALVLLFAYAIFREVYFDPFPGVFGSILGLSFFPLLLGSIMAGVARSRDEVQRASAFEGFAWGALVGLGLIFASMVVIRFSPAVSDWLQARALAMTGSGLSPAALGFVFGAGFSLVGVWLCLMWGRAVWWIRKRR